MSGDSLEDLSHDLGKEAASIADDVEKVVAKGLLNIKNQLKDEAKRSTHFKRIGERSITYEMESEDGAISGVVGPVKGWAGSLANIAYFGGANGGGASLPDPRGALHDEEDGFIANLDRLLGRGIA